VTGTPPNFPVTVPVDKAGPGLGDKVRLYGKPALDAAEPGVARTEADAKTIAARSIANANRLMM